MKKRKVYPAEKYSNRKIYIGKPYILKEDDGKVRLCAKVTINEEIKELYFEVEQKWEKYLVTEYSDAFILAVIKKAMKYSYDIEFEVPMSEDLYYNLVTYLIPVYARNLSILHEINLVGKTTTKQVDSLGKIGTGFSAGVDSFYTILKHLNNDKCPSHNVTHLLLTVNGAADTGISAERDAKWLQNSKKKLEPYANQLGLELICMGGNVDLLYAGDEIFGGDPVMSAAFVHALRKLFKIYYWASAYPAEVLEFPSEKDAGFWEDLAVPYVSIEGLRFHHSGSEINRIGKVAFIADNEIVQNCLTVCGSNDAQNCGCCIKCLRTMSELMSIGKLDLFQKVFPVDNYKKHFITKLAQEFTIDHAPFNTDIKRKMKENNIHIPIVVYFMVFIFYKPLEFIRGKLRSQRWARMIYYKLNLDSGLYGRKQSPEEREQKLNGNFK